MLKLSKSLSEESYEIEFLGKYIPEKFHPSWFVENKLLGNKEASEADIINITEGELTFFATKFIQIYIDTNRFKISTKQILSFDLVKDMAISISRILKDSISTFSINIRIHYTFKSKRKFVDFLSTHNTNSFWNEVLENPKIYSIKLIEEKKIDKGIHERRISIFPCDRPDMQNTIHLYVYNGYAMNSKNSNIDSFLEGNSDLLEESMVIIDKILNTLIS